MALIAQLGEHCTCIAEVVGSNTPQSLKIFSGLCSSSVTAALALMTAKTYKRLRFIVVYSVANNCFLDTMFKHTRHPPGFFASILNDACDRGCLSKYQPKVKPTVMGVCKLEGVVAKRNQASKTVYSVQWKHYSPKENTWELAEHLPGELIAAFKNRSLDPLLADKCRERLALLFEKGLNHHWPTVLC